MIQEHKELLLKDLCSRLPYGVKLHIPSFSDTPQRLQQISDYETVKINDYTSPIGIDEVKPYLRTMDSMTEEEAKEMFDTLFPYKIATIEIEQDKVKYGYIVNDNFCHTTFYFNDIYSLKQLDWLNEHHFDYRGLINKGLAIAVTEENNPYESKRV